jgi:pyruvate formate lyase activating enzyme
MHDGPGIRSTVFLKGCNMHCQWCHNPETINFLQEMLFYPEKCIHCGMCENGCYSGARVLCGKKMTAQEVMDEVLLDADYYQKEGGITVSGGEPCCQPIFTEEVLHLAKQAGIHTAIESNLNVPFDVLEKILVNVDLLMCDCKIFDDEKHMQYTGVSNRLILQNLKQLSTIDIPVIVRTPVIAGINDTIEEISHISMLASKLPNLRYYELLPYHCLGLSKGIAEHKKIKFDTPSKDTLHTLAENALKQVETVYVASMKYCSNTER